METIHKRSIYALIVLVIALLLLVVFKDRITKNPFQQHMAESMTLNNQAEMITSLQMSQRIQQMSTRIEAWRQLVMEDSSSAMQVWSNRQFFMTSLDGMVAQLDEMTDQLNAMTTNQNLIEQKDVKDQIAIIQKSILNLATSLENIIAASQRIQVSIEQPPAN
ncbi:hypothetical protein JW960_04355 [candidate division KSB1 bacterium]|nr:hypothetical protein [candidate division KSB1 bacterium]